ncbi:MAG: RNA polymerase sigma factor, partial [Spirochaetota bacterium]
MDGYLRSFLRADLARQTDDAVQEIMLRAYRSLDRYDGSRGFGPWLYSIARNYCVDMQRRLRTRSAYVTGCEDPDSFVAPR